jgi:hypothetical protein
MPSEGIETTISAGKRPQIHAFDPAATEIFSLCLNTKHILII